MSVVNAVGSLIARTTKLGVYCNAGRENAVASTKAFTTQVTVLALIALWFRQIKDKMQGSTSYKVETRELTDALMRLPIVFGMGLKVRNQCRAIAERIVNKEHCFVLGKGKFYFGINTVIKRLSFMSGHILILTHIFNPIWKGFGEPVALEGALKIKEMCYIHAEGYSGGALKHGPFALIEDEKGKNGATPIILLILDDHHANHMRTAAEEVRIIF